MPSLVEIISALLATMAKAVIDLRAAAEHAPDQATKDTLLAAAAKIQALSNDVDLNIVANSVIDELRDAILTGKSIVKHHSAALV